MEFVLVGFAFGVGYAWANFTRRLKPISMTEVFFGGEPSAEERDREMEAYYERRSAAGNY